MGRLYVSETGEIVNAASRLKQSEPTGPRPPLPGLMKWVVEFQGSLSGVTYIAANVLHVMAATPGQVTTGNMATLVPQLRTKYRARFGTLISSNWADTTHQLVALDGSGQEFPVSDAGGTTGSSSCLPPNAAVVLSWITNAYWRGGKFRTYLPGVIAANVSGGASGARLTSTAATNYANAGAGLANDVQLLTLGTSSLLLGGVSYYHHYAFRPTPLFFAFNGCATHPRVDSQRRRMGAEVP